MTSQQPVGGWVVVGVGESVDSCRSALAFAAREAGLRQVGVRLVHGCEPTAGPVTLEPVLPAGQREQQARDLLVEAATALRSNLDAALPVSTRVHPGTGEEALLDESARASILVVERRGRPAVQRWLEGSTSSIVGAKADCPVAVVHGGQGGSRTGHGIVVGVDDVGHAQRALRTAFDLAALRSTSVTAVHGWRFDEAMLAYGHVLPDPDAAAELRQRQGVLLAEAVAGFAGDYPDVPVKQVVLDEPPVDALLRAAALAELLVVGRHGSGRFRSLALGGIARRCLDAARCPVVVTPTSRPLRHPVGSAGRGDASSR